MSAGGRACQTCTAIPDLCHCWPRTGAARRDRLTSQRSFKRRRRGNRLGDCVVPKATHQRSQLGRKGRKIVSPRFEPSSGSKSTRRALPPAAAGIRTARRLCTQLLERSGRRFSHKSSNVDGRFACLRALKAEKLALKAYNRVLRIYRDLLLDGVIPDEDEWLRIRAASWLSSAKGNPEL